MNKLIEILNEIVPDVDFGADVSLIDDGLLTSLDIMRLVVEMSDQFDISISPADIVPSNFNKVADIQALINKLKK